MSREQPLGETQRLRTCKKQFLSLLNLFLSLRVEFVHLVRLEKKARRIVAVAARVSNHLQQLRLKIQASATLNLDIGGLPSAPSLAGCAFSATATGAGADVAT